MDKVQKPTNSHANYIYEFYNKERQPFHNSSYFHFFPTFGRCYHAVWQSLVIYALTVVLKERRRLSKLYTYGSQSRDGTVRVQSREESLNAHNRSVP
jgi:hypothetical protein